VSPASAARPGVVLRDTAEGPGQQAAFMPWPHGRAVPALEHTLTFGNMDYPPAGAENRIRSSGEVPVTGQAEMRRYLRELIDHRENCPLRQCGE